MYEHAEHIVAVSVKSSELLEFLPKSAASGRESRELLNLQRKKYGAIIQIIMAVLGNLARATASKPDHPQLSYVLESGDHGQGEFLDALHYIFNSTGGKQQKDLYSLRQYSVVPKGDGPEILGAADFIAWEWARHIANQGKGLEMRTSLSRVVFPESKSIFDRYGSGYGDGKRKYFVHYSGEHFSQAMQFKSELISESDWPEVMDRFYAWRER